MAIDPVSAARAYQQAAQASRTAAGVDGAESMDFGSLVQEAIRQAGASATQAEQQAMTEGIMLCVI